MSAGLWNLCEGRRAGLHLTLAIALGLGLPTHLSAQVKSAPEAKPGAAAKGNKEAPTWRVDAPPGPRTKIAIDTRKGTWMSVDVHPSGKALVFDLLGDLYELRFVGKGASPEARALTSGMAWDMQPRYSPDGRHIAFTSDRGGGDNIWLMERSGDHPRAVTTESFRLLNSPVWSPDGRFIAARKHFTSRRSLGAGEIWLYHRDGGAGVQMTKRANDQKDLGEPAFSPDGRFLYFSRDATPGKRFEYNKDPNGQIYVIDRLDRRTGRIEQVVGGAGGAIRPTPSPDGRSLAYIRRIRSRSVLMLRDLRSGAERRLYEGLDRDLQETWAVHGVYPAMAWMPVGGALVFWAGGGLHRVDVDDGRVKAIPWHVKGSREVVQALRLPVQAAPEKFQLKALRQVRVSPDGKRVVFQALGHLWLRDLAGGKPRRLTRQSKHFEFHPAWSPDGERIACTTWHDNDFGSVQIIDVRSGKGRKVTKEPGHYVEPAFSHDGRSMVWRKVRGGHLRSRRWSRNPGIWLLAKGSKRPVRISRKGHLPHFDARDERVWFTRGDGWKAKKRELVSVRLADRKVVAHVSSKFALAFTVSPDGRWLAFQEGYAVWLMPLPAAGRTFEVGPKSKGLPLARVSSDGGDHLHWSGDSRSLHWSLGADLWTIEVDNAFKLAQKAPATAKNGEVPAKKTEPSAAARRVAIGMEQASDRHDATIALVGARLITMRGDEVIEDGTLLWKGGRIIAVGARAKVALPKGARVLDGKGLTAMPGLIDVHHHGGQGRDGLTPQQNWANLSLLSFGVTTVHDPSNHTATVFAAAELQRAGMIVAPRIFSTGTILYGARATITAHVDSLEDAKRHIRRLKAWGAFSVKSYNQPRRDQRQQVLAAARQLGMMVVPEGGALFMHNMTQVVDGHTGVEHAIPIATAYKDVLQLWAHTKVGYTPTLNVAYGGLAGENYWYAHTDVHKHQRLGRFVPPNSIDPRSRRPRSAPPEEYNHIAAARFATRLVRAGGQVQLGAHGQREGLGVHWELWSLTQGGMKPLEALRAATLHGARYIGLDRDLGSLEPGKLADVAIVAGKPDVRIRDSESVRWTVLGGRVYDGATVDEIAPRKVVRPAPWWRRKGEGFSSGGVSRPTCPCGLGDG